MAARLPSGAATIAGYAPISGSSALPRWRMGWLRRSSGIAMPAAGELSLIVGGDGFLGRNLEAYFTGHGLPFVALGRSAGDLRDRATVLRLFEQTPPVGRILHVATFQR